MLGMMGAVPGLPDGVRRRHKGWTWSVASAYFPGVTTYRLDGPAGEIRFLKLSSNPRAKDLHDECARTHWAAAHLRVPEVIDCGAEGTVEWMLTEGIDAPDATSGELRADPARLVVTLARGLSRFHEAPVDACPFDFRLDTALELVGQRLAAGLIDPVADLHPEHRHLTPEQAYAQLLADRPPSEDLVVCHGDY
jgi:aminoglycoside 3'-phosphotransferase-2